MSGSALPISILTPPLRGRALGVVLHQLLLCDDGVMMMGAAQLFYHRRSSPSVKTRARSTSELGKKNKIENGVAVHRNFAIKLRSSGRGPDRGRREPLELWLTCWLRGNLTELDDGSAASQLHTLRCHHRSL